MKKLLLDAFADAKNLPKGLWVAAVIVPGGIATITVYLAGKAAYQKFKKEHTDGRQQK
jgi:L-ascorbate metabolism protein UlaG (beta-lactamase superfamily)